jgi:hypothetical protein
MNDSIRLPDDDATKHDGPDGRRVGPDISRRPKASACAPSRKSECHYTAGILGAADRAMSPAVLPGALSRLDQAGLLRRVGRFCSGVALLGLLTGGAYAQGWGEQRPLQFGIVGPGGNMASTEIVRRQLQLTEAQTAVLLWNAAEAAAANAAASASGGGGSGVQGVNGSTQGSEQLNNAVKTAPVLNVTVSGAGNSVTVSPNAQAVTVGQTTQTSTGTNQGASNSQSTAPKFLNVPNDTAQETGSAR